MVEYEVDEGTEISGFQRTSVHFFSSVGKRHPFWGIASDFCLAFVSVVLLNKSYHLKVNVTFSLLLEICCLPVSYLWNFALLLPSFSFCLHSCIQGGFMEGLIHTRLCLWHKKCSSKDATLAFRLQTVI
jgi:hypothetical protein